MIKKERIEKYVGVIVLKVLLILVGIRFLILSFQQQPFEGSLIFLMIGFSLILFSLMSIIETFERVEYPERFNYCKKCKKTIRKKDIFCSDCRMNIRRVIRNKENEKYVKDYTKFYKGKKK